MGRLRRAPWAPGLALGAVLGTALVVRLAGIGHPLLPDEGYTWLVASAGSPGGFLTRLARYENTPPLYYLLITPLPLSSVWLIRLPSLLSGVGLVGVTWAIVAPRFGRAAAVIAALALAVAPYAVAESDFGRAYMLADLWLLLCVRAALELVETDDARWWWLYVAGAILAVYTEYDAATVLAPLVVALIWLRRGRRRATLGLSLLPGVAFLPWLGQFARSRHDFGVTKAGLGYRSVTPAAMRDQLVVLAFGRTGQNLGPEARTAACVGLLAVLGLAGIALYRCGSHGRPTLAVLACAAVGCFMLHAVAALLGIGIFSVGYLTFLLPVGAVVLGTGLSTLPGRLTPAIICAALVLVGAGLTVERIREAPDIRVAAIRDILAAARVRTVLTNSAVVDYYFRAAGAVLDRPFDLGPGLEQTCGACARPIAVVDDTDVAGGARPGPGPTRQVGHYAVRVLPDRSNGAR